MRKYAQKLENQQYFGLCSRVGIARPAFCTCPVTTLIIFGSKALLPSTKTSLYLTKEGYTSKNISNPKTLLKRFENQPDKVQVVKTDEYMAIDFSKYYNSSALAKEICPLLWIRF